MQTGPGVPFLTGLCLAFCPLLIAQSLDRPTSGTKPLSGIDQLRHFQRDPLAAPRLAPPVDAFELEIWKNILPPAARERRLLRKLKDCSTEQLHAQLKEQWRAARRYVYLHEEHSLVSALLAQADLKLVTAATLGLADWEDGYGHPYASTIGDHDIDIEDDGRQWWARLAAEDWVSARDIALSLRGQETMILSLTNMGEEEWAEFPPERIPDFFQLLTEMDDLTLFPKHESAIPPDLYYWTESRFPHMAKDAISRLAVTRGRWAAVDSALKIKHPAAREAALEAAEGDSAQDHAVLPARVDSPATLRMVLSSHGGRIYPFWNLEILLAAERLDAVTAAQWVQGLTPLEVVSQGGMRVASRWAELDPSAALTWLISLSRTGVNLSGQIVRSNLIDEMFAAATGDDLRLKALEDLPELLRPMAVQGFLSTASLDRTEEWLTLQPRWNPREISPLLTRIALTDPDRALALHHRLFPDQSTPYDLRQSGLMAAWLVRDFPGAARFMEKSNESDEARYLNQYVQLLPLPKVMASMDLVPVSTFNPGSLDGTWKWLTYENPDTILPALRPVVSDSRFRDFVLSQSATAALFHPLEAVQLALSLKPVPSRKEMQPILEIAAGVRNTAIRDFPQRYALPTSDPDSDSSR